MKPTALNDILAKHRATAGALLPILHDVQDAFGYVPEAAVPLIAAELDLSRAEVHGVLSYNHYFRLQPPGRHVVRVCCAEACQARGAEALAAHAEARLRGSGLLLEPVYCLGLCAVGPAVQVDEMSLHADVTPKKFDALMATLAEQS